MLLTIRSPGLCKDLTSANPWKIIFSGLCLSILGGKLWQNNKSSLSEALTQQRTSLYSMLIFFFSL